MKFNQNDAILNYLEFHLLAFVEETQKHISDDDVVGDMYDRAYAILHDFDNTLQMQSCLEATRPLTSNKKS